jgi:hypothetical protein
VLYQLSYTSSRRRIDLAASRDEMEDDSGPRAALGVHGQTLAAVKDGATPQNRTGDTRIFSAVLYQLS